MSNNVKRTKHVEGRREVRYASLNEFLQDAERLANSDTQTLGNWSVGQIYKHMAQSLDVSIDGMKMLPAPMRWLLSILLKKRFLTRPMSAGFKTSRDMIPDGTITDVGLNILQQAIARQYETEQRAPHPGFGTITHAEWEQFHLRHAEMHMSFIVPADSTR